MLGHLREDWPFWAVVAGVVLLVFVLQPPNQGFYGPNHGWTSSHGLAIMSHASPSNAFVGHALQFRGGDGSLSYTYFDRYPPFFSAFMNGVLALGGGLPGAMVAARAAMNVIFLVTIGLAGMLAYQLNGGNPWLALAAALLAFSGYEMVFYKDMVHYDQPALLGNMLMLLAIARYKLAAPPRWTVYAAALVAVGLGRGYSSLVILAAWATWEVLAGLSRHAAPVPRRLWAAMRCDAVGALGTGLAWALLWIGYNVSVEAARRGIPLIQTSIVDSALRRLPVGPDPIVTRPVEGQVPGLGEFAVLQFGRLVRWWVPFNWDVLPPGMWWGGLLVTLAAFGLALVRFQGMRRPLALLTAGWGLAWIVFMINLTHGHEYTLMYVAGVLLVFYVGLLSIVGGNAWAARAITLVALLVFAWVLWSVRAEVGNNRAEYTYDYQRIAERIQGEGRGVYVNISDGECVIEDDYCYVLGFYLRDYYLSPFAVADYVLERQPYYYADPIALAADDTEGLLLLRDSLTPENEQAFIFDKATATRRFIPSDAAPIVTFGDALTLQHWQLTDPVTVAPCGRVHLESWWLATAPLPANYSMLVAMTGPDGEAVADTNAGLTHVVSRVWQPERYHLDARYIDVPCDTPPGEYALVMSVYEPGNPPSLPVTAADGTPMSDFFYLTTLFVEAAG